MKMTNFLIYRACRVCNVHLQALKEEEEILIIKRQVHIDEMHENEHQQKQMEICGQGLEMKLRDQGQQMLTIA